MTFTFHCRACGHENRADYLHAGRPATCTGCGEGLTVPAPMETASGESPRSPLLRFVCPECGRKYATKPEMIGKKIRCGGCGKGVRVPGEAPTAAVPVATAQKAVRTVPPMTARRPADVPPPADALHSDDWFEPFPTPKPENSSDRDAVGTVLPSRSEAMEGVRQSVAAKEAEEQEKAAKKKKKRKKKGSGYFDPKDVLALVGGVAAFVAVLGGLAYAVPDFRFPVGGLLCLVGFIVYLLGAAALRQLAAEEGDLQALMFRFVPPYQWWFVATRWSDARDFVAFFVAGVIIMTVGGLVIKTSPVGKEADASERALKAMSEGRDDGPPPVLHRDGGGVD